MTSPPSIRLLAIEGVLAAMVAAGCGDYGGSLDAALTGPGATATPLTFVEKVTTGAPVMPYKPGQLCADQAVDGNLLFGDCTSAPVSFDNVRCQVDYQLCLGAEAYSKAFSFLSPPTVEEKRAQLRNAMHHLSRAMAYILLVST